MVKNYISIDLGATSGCVLLGNFQDSTLKLEEVHRFANPLIQMNGHFYWDIYFLYNEILEGLKKVSEKNITIQSIGIDTWGVDFVMVGKDGHFLRAPFSYRDPHTNGAPEAFFSRFPKKRVYEITGIQTMNFNSLFQFDTLLKNNDSVYAVADKLLFMPDALSYLLTGEMVTEYTIATTAQIVNAKTRKLDEEILSEVGLSSNSFGKFVFPGETIGVLTKEVQSITGLSNIPVIAVAGHDTASAVVAVPAQTPNFAYLSSGTWSLMGIENDEPVITEESEKLNLTNEGGVNDTIRVLKNICGMWLLERCRLEWKNTPYSTLINEANEAIPFASFINPDDPLFANPSNMIRAIEQYCEKSGQVVPESRGAIVRCIFESLAMRYKEVFGYLKEVSTRPLEVLHIIGGGSKNRLLNQYTANALGISVIAGPGEATGIGNMMIQVLADDKEESIDGLRKEVYNSIPLETYKPMNNGEWERAYSNYLKAVEKYNN